MQSESFRPAELRARAFFGVALGLFLWLLVILTTLVAARQGSGQPIQGAGVFFLLSGYGALLLPSLDLVEHVGVEMTATDQLLFAAGFFGLGLGAWLVLVFRWRRLLRLPWWGHAVLVIAWCFTNLVAFLAQAASSLPS